MNCSIEGCEKKSVSRSWCGLHYKRWHRSGDVGPVRARPTLEERLWAKVNKEGDENGCWNWTAALRNGYGVIGQKKSLLYAHRVSYELLVGLIPVGYQIDHLCRNRRCVNPAHLEAVTQQENIRRQLAHQYPWRVVA
jgi:hypothetical protein